MLFPAVYGDKNCKAQHFWRHICKITFVRKAMGRRRAMILQGCLCMQLDVDFFHPMILSSYPMSRHLSSMAAYQIMLAPLNCIQPCKVLKNHRAKPSDGKAIGFNGEKADSSRGRAYR